MQVHPADREGADHRRLLLPPQHGAAVRLSGQRPRLRRELPLDDVQDGRARATSPTRRSTARSRCCSSSTPTTSRTAPRTRCAAIGSSNVDPYSALAGAAAALYGPLHGGANEAVLRMLAADRRRRRASPSSSQRVKAGEGRLMGFGHRVYKNYDPRAKIIKETADSGVRGDGPQPAARHRARAGEDRARGRVLRLAEALPERRLLLGSDLPGARAADVDVPGACSRSRARPAGSRSGSR